MISWIPTAASPSETGGQTDPEDVGSGVALYTVLGVGDSDDAEIGVAIAVCAGTSVLEVVSG